MDVPNLPDPRLIIVNRTVGGQKGAKHMDVPNRQHSLLIIVYLTEGARGAKRMDVPNRQHPLLLIANLTVDKTDECTKSAQTVY